MQIIFVLLKEELQLFPRVHCQDVSAYLMLIDVQLDINFLGIIANMPKAWNQLQHDIAVIDGADSMLSD